MNRKTSQGETPVFVNLLSDMGFKRSMPIRGTSRCIDPWQALLPFSDMRVGLFPLT